MAVHGDITEVTYSHPTIGSGVLFPKAGEGNTFDPGGFRNSDDTSMVAGNGSLMVQKNRVTGSFEITIENDMVTDTLATLKALAESPVSANWTASHISGTVYGGTGVIVGDISADTNAGTIALKVNFGSLAKQ